VSDHPVHRDDITALRGEGDLPAYIRQLKDEGRARLTTQPGSKSRRNRRRWGAIPIPPDHKPGAWPPGTSPPGPAPEHALPAQDWADAVNRYRTEELQAAEENET
jgi:hypothetical protein